MRATDPPIIKPSKLWRHLPAERRHDTARTFWADSEDPVSQAEAVQAIARHLKFRPQSVLALPIEKRTRYLTALPAVSDTLAARLLITYHLAYQRPMMTAFLDALGITHEDGLITAEEVKPPDPDACRNAARALLTEFPPDDVRTYFATLLAQDQDTWSPLEELI